MKEGAKSGEEMCGELSEGMLAEGMKVKLSEVMGA